jgi:endoglucanase
MKPRILIAPRTRLASGLLCAGLLAVSAAPGQPAAASATSHAESVGNTAPELHVSGNTLVNARGQRVVLRGVDRSGGEYTCV